jgi:hypothetical protein
MVIEKYKNNNSKAVYTRVQEKGRMIPDGLRYINSWVEANLGRCFQLMDCDQVDLFQQWIVHWNDLIEFEIIPVVSSKEAIEILKPQM